jgi:hypothetical protein
MEESHILLYLAKPIYGGWVSFTSHLSLTTSYNIYKIGNKTERTQRSYGYNTTYRNISLNTLKEFVDSGIKIVVTAIDKNYYHVLDSLPSSSYIVIHDPTEFNKKSKKIVLDHIRRLNVITIRKSVHDLLLNEYNINSIYRIHPYYSANTVHKLSNGSGGVSISRVDYDKNTHIIVMANMVLENSNKIEIYGDINERYIYHKLMEYDDFRRENPASNYRGKFPKKFVDLEKILRNHKFVVDLSTISQDGGGTQYTFLEAIDFGCVLILNKQWCDNPNSIWHDGVNCVVVQNSEELVYQINSNFSGYNLPKIYKNSLKILDGARKVNWLDILSS